MTDAIFSFLNLVLCEVSRLQIAHNTWCIFFVWAAKYGDTAGSETAQGRGEKNRPDKVKTKKLRRGQDSNLREQSSWGGADKPAPHALTTRPPHPNWRKKIKRLILWAYLCLLYFRAAALMTDIGGTLVTFYALDLFMWYQQADVEHNSIGNRWFRDPTWTQIGDKPHKWIQEQQIPQIVSRRLVPKLWIQLWGTRMRYLELACYVCSLNQLFFLSRNQPFPKLLMMIIVIYLFPNLPFGNEVFQQVSTYPGSCPNNNCRTISLHTCSTQPPNGSTKKSP